jgi:single-stranded DNA-binding protein
MAQAKIGELVIVAGTATRDAEYKTIGKNNAPICEFSLAVGKNADGSGKFAECKAWRSLAKLASHISKGDSVCVIGTLESREHNGKTYTKLVADWLNIAWAAQNTAADQGQKPQPPVFNAETDIEQGELPF